MGLQGDDTYSKLDVYTLTNLITNPESKPDIHRKAFDALAALTADSRREHLTTVVKAIFKRPDKYDHSLLYDAIELGKQDHVASDAAYSSIYDMHAQDER